MCTNIIFIEFSFDCKIGQSGAFLVAGKIEAGYVQNGDKVLLMPAGEQGSVKGTLLFTKL